MFRNDNPHRLRRIAFRIAAICCATMAVIPALHAQSGSVTLPSRQVSVSQVLDRIQQQTPYKIGLNWSELDPSRKVTLSAEVLTVKDLLSQVLAGTGYSWQMMDDHITLWHQGQALQSAVTSGSSHVVVVQDPESERYGIDGPMNGWMTEKNVESLEQVMLYFKVNRSLLERNFMDNAKSMDEIGRIFSDETRMRQIDYVTITAASSPEGNTAVNDRLAKERALAVKEYLKQKYPGLESNRIFTYSIGEDWSGLRKMVEEDPATPYRKAVLDLLGSTGSSDQKRSKLKAIGGGEAYSYISTNMLPYLRGAAACMIYFKRDGQSDPTGESAVRERVIETYRTDTVYVERIVEVPVVVQEPAVTEKVNPRKPYYCALKTNLLYDALALPNLGFEFAMGRRWSFAIGGAWAWWDTGDPKHYKYRIQAAGAELRYWPGRRDGRNTLSGWHIGAYGYCGTYDIRFGETGYMSDWSYSGGLTFGYSLPIGRRLNLDFGLGVGYFGGEYKTYTYYAPQDCYPLKGIYKSNYFGLTNAEVSLVWLIGSGKNPAKSKK